MDLDLRGIAMAGLSQPLLYSRRNGGQPGRGTCALVRVPGL